jgi:hypothetical protein
MGAAYPFTNRFFCIQQKRLGKKIFPTRILFNHTTCHLLVADTTAIQCSPGTNFSTDSIACVGKKQELGKVLQIPAFAV